MRKHALLALAGLMLVTPSLVAQTSATAPVPIPEEARKHFVMGATLFKDAKTPDDYAQVESEFKQAVDLAPQWPDARYNLALAKEAAGDYAGAMADLKIYLQFKLSEADARTAQDKIYEVEAKQAKANDPATKERDEAEQHKIWVENVNRDFAGLFQDLDGAFYAGESSAYGVVRQVEIRIHRGGPYDAMYLYKRTKVIASNDPKTPVTGVWSEVFDALILPTSETEFRDEHLSIYRISPDARTLYDLGSENEVDGTYARQ